MMTVGDFKTNFSSVIQEILKGNSVGISYGKKKEAIAVVSPFKKAKKKKVKLGFLEGKATFKINNGWKMTDEEFLAS